MSKAIAFLAFSMGLLYVSRKSLRRFHSHGFYRFFAWEAILALILLHINRWFLQPASAHQIVSWLFLSISLFMVIHGVQLLRTIGKPDTRRLDPDLMGIEKTTRLVTVGAYRFIRHPLYSSLLFLAWGAFFKMPSRFGGVLVIAASVFLAATAKIEETENLRYFGPVYKEYMGRTKMFVPFIF